MGGKEYYPKDVWSPAGGWYADPRGWRRNTAIAYAAAFAIIVPVWMLSAHLEQRPNPPTHWIPSQLWCKNIATKKE